MNIFAFNISGRLEVTLTSNDVETKLYKFFNRHHFRWAVNAHTVSSPSKHTYNLKIGDIIHVHNYGRFVLVAFDKAGLREDVTAPIFMKFEGVL